MNKSRSRKSISAHLLLSALLMSMMFLTGCDQSSTSPINTGADVKSAPKQAIDFTLPDLAGRPHTLAEYLRRGPVVLVFFTTWCPFCQKEIPALKQVYQEYGARGLQLVAINAGLADSLENARRYALEHRLPYVVLYDPDGVTAGQYGVRAVPKVVYIQSTGRIVHASQYIDKRAIDRLLITQQQ